MKDQEVSASCWVSHSLQATSRTSDTKRATLNYTTGARWNN